MAERREAGVAGRLEFCSEEPDRGHHQKAAPAIRIRISRLASISRTASLNMRRARKNITASDTTPNTATVIAIVIKIK